MDRASSCAAVPTPMRTSPASIVVWGEGLVSKLPSGRRTASTRAPVRSCSRTERSVLPASGEEPDTSISSRRNSRVPSCMTTSMKSTTWGCVTNDAMRSPPSCWGFTTRLAPARTSLGSEDSLRARAMMLRSGRMARHATVTKRLSASVSSAATSAAARSTPAWRSVSSSVASPVTDG